MFMADATIRSQVELAWEPGCPANSVMLLLTEARNSASCGSILAAAAPAKSVVDPTMKPPVTPVLRARETTAHRSSPRRQS